MYNFVTTRACLKEQPDSDSVSEATASCGRPAEEDEEQVEATSVSLASP